jgi:DNA-binding beta-propeller fold protein YncE
VAGWAAESAFTYDLSRFREIDPALIGYREVEPIPLPEGAYTALAVGEDGGMAVAGAGGLVLLDAAGAVRLQRPLPQAATCLATGPGGRVYVGQSDHILVVEADGSSTEAWMALGEQAILTSVAAAGEWVVVADAGQHRVFVFDLSGRLVRQWDGTESGSTVGFVIPSPYFDVAAGPDGSFWVVNPGQLQLVQYDAAGRVGAMWGQSGMAVDRFCGCCNPVHIAVLPDGALVTAEKGIARLKVYRADGTFRAVVAGPDQFAGDQAGDDVAVDGRTGRIRVLDAANHRVRVFEAMREAEVQP